MNFISYMFRTRPVENIMASKLLSRYEDRIVNLDSILHDANITLKEMPDPEYDNALSQFLESGPDGYPTIYINTKYSIEYQRIGIAFALGHYFLRHGDCSRQTCEQFYKKNSQCISALKFAIELLLPENIMKTYTQKRKTIKQIADIFQLPTPFIQQRLKKLNLPLY